MGKLDTSSYILALWGRLHHLLSQLICTCQDPITVPILEVLRHRIEWDVKHLPVEDGNVRRETVLIRLHRTTNTVETWAKRAYVAWLALDTTFFADMTSLMIGWGLNTAPDFSSPFENYDLKPILRSFLSSHDHLKPVLDLKNEEAVGFLDLLQSMMDEISPHDAFYRRCISCLRKLSRASGQLPSSFSIAHGLQTIGNHPLGGGGYADVWKGRLDGHGMVAIKSLRIFSRNPSMVENARQAFLKEAIIWRQLKCPRILTLFGVSETLFPLCLVSPWMENGSIMEYLESNPTVNRLNLMLETAQGLSYLHDHNIVHGDLKGANVLIDDEGHACICDFGLAVVAQVTHSIGSSSISASTKGTLRWMAPELLFPDQYGLSKSNPSSKSDVYAFACTTLEVLIGRPPFAHHRFEAAVLSDLQAGGRPPKPTSTEVVERGLSDVTWRLIEDCWSDHLTQRPSMSEVLEQLEYIVLGSAVLRQTYAESDGSDGLDPDITEVEMWLRDCPELHRPGGQRRRSSSQDSALSRTVVGSRTNNGPHSRHGSISEEDHRLPCRHCREPIVGTRYQCATCPSSPQSYNLCAKCEVRSYLVHDPRHVFIKIPRVLDRPIQTQFPLISASLYTSPAGIVSGRRIEPQDYIQTLYHRSAICDRCVETIQGVWLRCAYCFSDLCEDCESLGKHDRTHVFLVLKSNVNMNRLGETCNIDYPARSAPIIPHPVYMSF